MMHHLLSDYGYKLADHITQESRIIVINDWSDYIKQSSIIKPMGRHLYQLSFAATGPLGINIQKNCIHHACSSIESCVNRLIGMMKDPYNAVSTNGLGKQLFSENPYDKKLCKQCILLFLIKTNNCQTIIDYLHTMYCYSNRSIFNNPCLWYFTRIILIYPTVIKFIMKRANNIHKLSEIVIFYLSAIKSPDSLHTESKIFCNPNKGYKITKQSLITLFIYEYNLCAVLLSFCTLIPYFTKQHLLKLIQLRFPEILLDFISNSNYMQLMHVKSNINKFYKKSNKYSSIYIDKPEKLKEKITFHAPNGMIFNAGSVRMNSNQSAKFTQARNAVLAKLVNVYCFLREKVEYFKDDSRFIDAYNNLEHFTRMRFIEYKNHSLEQCFEGNVTDRTITDEYKLFYFFHWGKGSGRYSIKELKKKNVKLKSCGNDKCIRKYRKNKKKFRLCKGCRFALYCCKKCQKIDWSIGKHRDYCN